MAMPVFPSMIDSHLTPLSPSRPPVVSQPEDGAIAGGVAFLGAAYLPESEKASMSTQDHAGLRTIGAHTAGRFSTQGGFRPATFGEQFPGSGFGPASGAAARRCRSSLNDFGPRIWLKVPARFRMQYPRERQGADQ